MIQVDVDDAGDLYFSFKDVDNNIVIVHKLLNGGEIEFLNDECIGLELLNFESQLGRGKINNIELLGVELQDDNFIFHIDVDGQLINGKVNLSLLKDKV